MINHTPGPFEICQDDFDDTYYIRKQGAEKGDGFIVERIVAERISKKADAAVFSAAPELLAALEAITNDCDPNSRIAKIAREAIAKARSEK